jgi:hypothetical protein
MAEVTIQQTRKTIKIQKPFAVITLGIGAGLMLYASQSGERLPNNATMINGWLTCFAGVVWVSGLRLARWWYHG